MEQCRNGMLLNIAFQKRNVKTTSKRFPPCGASLQETVSFKYIAGQALACGNHS